METNGGLISVRAKARAASPRGVMIMTALEKALVVDTAVGIPAAEVAVGGALGRAGMTAKDGMAARRAAPHTSHTVVAHLPCHLQAISPAAVVATAVPFQICASD